MSKYNNNDIISNNIFVSSYNSGGMGLDKQSYIKPLCLFSDILCIQEHFLLDAESLTIRNIITLIN